MAPGLGRAGASSPALPPLTPPSPALPPPAHPEPPRERGARAAGEPDPPLDVPQPRSAPIDVLDPMARTLAQPLVRGAEPAPAAAPPSPLSPPDELLLDRLVKRLSWGGNGRRGSARIELGAGSLAGATLLVHADGSELTLEIEGADPRAAEEFTARISQRLGDKGFSLRQA